MGEVEEAGKGKRKRDSAYIQEAVTEEPKRTRVQAQRKFAQGAGGNSPQVSPVKEVRTRAKPIDNGSSSSSSSGGSSALVAQRGERPKTEDFLTFLCLRGTDLLPPDLAFFNKASTTAVIESSEEESSDPDQDDSKDYVVKKSVVKKLAPKQSEKDKKIADGGVNALKKKYTEQRLAKNETVKKNLSKSLPSRKTRSQSQDSASSPDRNNDRRSTRSTRTSDNVLVNATLRKPSNAAIVAKKKSKLAVAKIVENGRASPRSRVLNRHTDKELEDDKNLNKKRNNLSLGTRSLRGRNVSQDSSNDSFSDREDHKEEVSKGGRRSNLKSESETEADADEETSSRESSRYPKPRRSREDEKIKDSKVKGKESPVARLKKREGRSTSCDSSGSKESLQAATVRRSRKTKEAAKTYLNMLGQKLASKKRDDDAISIESFSSTAQEKRLEEFEKEDKVTKAQLDEKQAEKIKIDREVERHKRLLESSPQRLIEPLPMPKKEVDKKIEKLPDKTIKEELKSPTLVGNGEKFSKNVSCKPEKKEKENGKDSKEHKDAKRERKKEKKKAKTNMKDFQNILLADAKRKIADSPEPLHAASLSGVSTLRTTSSHLSIPTSTPYSTLTVPSTSTYTPLSIPSSTPFSVYAPINSNERPYFFPSHQAPVETSTPYFLPAVSMPANSKPFLATVPTTSADSDGPDLDERITISQKTGYIHVKPRKSIDHLSDEVSEPGSPSRKNSGAFGGLSSKKLAKAGEQRNTPPPRKILPKSDLEPARSSASPVVTAPGRPLSSHLPVGVMGAAGLSNRLAAAPVAMSKPGSIITTNTPIPGVPLITPSAGTSFAQPLVIQTSLQSSQGSVPPKPVGTISIAAPSGAPAAILVPGPPSSQGNQTAIRMPVHMSAVQVGMHGVRQGVPVQVGTVRPVEGMPMMQPFPGMPGVPIIGPHGMQISNFQQFPIAMQASVSNGVNNGKPQPTVVTVPTIIRSGFAYQQPVLAGSIPPLVNPTMTHAGFGQRMTAHVQTHAQSEPMPLTSTHSQISSTPTFSMQSSMVSTCAPYSIQSSMVPIVTSSVQYSMQSTTTSSKMDSSQVAKITEVAAMQASVPPPLSSASPVIYTSTSPLVSPGPPTLSPQIAGSPRSVTMSTSSTKQMTKPDMAPPILTPPVRKTEVPAVEEAANQLPTSVQKHEHLASVQSVQKTVNPPQIPKHIPQMMSKQPVINEPTQQSINKSQMDNPGPGVYIPVQPQAVPYLHSPEAYPSLQQISPNSYPPNQSSYPPVLSPRYHQQTSPTAYPGHHGNPPIPITGPYQPTQQPEYPQGYPVQYSYPSQPPPAHHTPLTHRGSQIQQRPVATTTPPTNLTPTNIISTNHIPINPMPTHITPTSHMPTNLTPTNPMAASSTPSNSMRTNITSAHAMPTNLTPTNTPSNSMPTHVTPANAAPITAIPTNISPNNNTSTNNTSRNPSPTNGAPRNPIPTNITERNPTPNNITPTNATSNDITPTNASPTNITPTNISPTNSTSRNTTLTHSTPTNVIPRNVTPTNIANSEQHMQQSPNQEAQIPSNQSDTSESIQAPTVPKQQNSDKGPTTSTPKLNRIKSELSASKDNFPLSKKKILNKVPRGSKVTSPSPLKPEKSFNVENEASAYAFDTEPSESTIPKMPFRKANSPIKPHTPVNSKLKQPIESPNMPVKPKSHSTPRKPDIVPGSSKVETPKVKTEDSNIAVQCDLDSSNDKSKMEVSEVQGEDGSSSDNETTYFIPLQNSSGQQFGVAVKLGTDGPCGPNQKVIMTAKLVTHPSNKPMNAKIIGGKTTETTSSEVSEQESVKSPVPSSSIKASDTDTPRKHRMPIASPESPNQGASSFPDPALRTNQAKARPRMRRAATPDSVKSSEAEVKEEMVQKKRGPLCLLGPVIKGHQFPKLGQHAEMMEAPTFRPSEADFKDPLRYIEKIRSTAEPFGMCRIIPPKSFKPECNIDDDMRFNAYNQYINRMFSRWGPNAKETAAIKKYLETQNVDTRAHPLVGGLEVDLPALYHAVQSFGGLSEVIQKKKWGKIAEYLRISRGTHASGNKLDDIYVKWLLPYDTLSGVEREELLRLVEEEWMEQSKEKAERSAQRDAAGSDDEPDEDEEDEEEKDQDQMAVAEKGKSTSCSAFYRLARNLMATVFRSESDPPPHVVEDEYWKIVADKDVHMQVAQGSIDTGREGYGFPIRNSPMASHPWNLKVLTQNSRSVLRALGTMMGVTVPTVHLGMLFTTACWYRDPHGLPWIEYLHTGSPRLWYGIPDSHSLAFYTAMKQLVPSFCKDRKIWLPRDTTMVSPALLVKHGVSVARTVQQPGQFIVVFPKSYSSTICTGYSVSESAYYATIDWLQASDKIFQDIRESLEGMMFPLEKLFFRIAADPKSTRSMLTTVLPKIEDIKDREFRQRQALTDLGLKQTERLNLNEHKNEEDDEYECRVCATNLYVSLLADNEDETTYCLSHGIEHLKENKNMIKRCKLMYTHTREEIKEILKNLQDRLAESDYAEDPKVDPPLQVEEMEDIVDEDDKDLGDADDMKPRERSIPSYIKKVKPLISSESELGDEDEDEEEEEEEDEDDLEQSLQDVENVEVWFSDNDEIVRPPSKRKKPKERKRSSESEEDSDASGQEVEEVSKEKSKKDVPKKSGHIGGKSKVEKGKGKQIQDNKKGKRKMQDNYNTINRKSAKDKKEASSDNEDSDHDSRKSKFIKMAKKEGKKEDNTETSKTGRNTRKVARSSSSEDEKPSKKRKILKSKKQDSSEEESPQRNSKQVVKQKNSKKVNKESDDDTNNSRKNKTNLKSGKATKREEEEVKTKKWSQGQSKNKDSKLALKTKEKKGLATKKTINKPKDADKKKLVKAKKEEKREEVVKKRRTKKRKAKTIDSADRFNLLDILLTDSEAENWKSEVEESGDDSSSDDEYWK